MVPQVVFILFQILKPCNAPVHGISINPLISRKILGKCCLCKHSDSVEFLFSSDSILLDCLEWDSLSPSDRDAAQGKHSPDPPLFWKVSHETLTMPAATGTQNGNGICISIINPIGSGNIEEKHHLPF